MFLIILQNHVLFCTVRVHSVNNETWLKSPVGWVLERGAQSKQPSLIPVSMSKLLELNKEARPTLSTPVAERGSTKEVVLLKKHLSQNGTKTEIRMQKIVALQEQMEEMAATISKVQESLVITQCLVSRLLDGILTTSYSVL